LDLIIADWRGQSTDVLSYRTGLYSDFFDEDLTRMLKVKAIKVLCRGTTSSGFDGLPVGDTDEEQYRACFRHIKTHLDSGRTGFNRVATLIILLTNMDNWSMFNEIYREFISIPPCRVVIGTTTLAQKPLAIEIAECIGYRVAE
jgi:enamine deaminase RidA (YjgF/YER057c/UK114 family)